jgi:GrpB-like predicted nucleotidyltransferase (UPF0157 family)
MPERKLRSASMAEELKAYDSRWPEQYEREKEVIKRVLGAALCEIEHVGSTSILGMPAKPIIDIAATVSGFDRIDEECVRRFADIGYTHVPHEWFKARRFFRRGPAGAGSHHLHVFEKGNDEYDKMVLFRDFLRRSPSAANEYLELKATLAANAADRQAYTDRKGPFVLSIVERARRVLR